MRTVARIESRPLDEARLHSRYRKLTLDAEVAEKVRQILAESRDDEPPEEPRRHELTKPGDPEQMRGVPIRARGVRGAHKGSVPHFDGVPDEE